MPNSNIARQFDPLWDSHLPARLAALPLDFNIRLPRLLSLANFWSQFYEEANYAFEAEHLAPAQELFEKEDAELAARHAQACLQAASCLRSLSEDQLAASTESSRVR